MKKLLFSVVLIFAFSASAFAAEQVHIDAVQYGGDGKVDIDVHDQTSPNTKIVWTDQETIEVRDSKGNYVNAELTKSDDDTFRVVIPNYRDDEHYSFELNNVSVGKHMCMNFTDVFVTAPAWLKSLHTTKVTVNGQTPQPAAAYKSTLYVGAMTFDKNVLKVDIDDSVGHDNEILWDGQERVTVRGANGARIACAMTSVGIDKATLELSGLNPGAKYVFKLENFLYRGKRDTLYGTFVATDGWSYRDPRKK